MHAGDLAAGHRGYRKCTVCLFDACLAAGCWLQASQIPVELCLTSNVKTNRQANTDLAHL